MEMPDELFIEDGLTGLFPKEWTNGEYIKLEKLSLYHHSRIVESLRRENEELHDRLKPHPKCDSACMFLCESGAELLKKENEELKAKLDKTNKLIQWLQSENRKNISNVCIDDEGMR